MRSLVKNIFFSGLLTFYFCLCSAQSDNSINSLESVVSESDATTIESYSKEIAPFISGDRINLKYLREVCHFLTDSDCTLYKGLIVPKRQKAFVRHIKHLNEDLEQAYRDNRKVDDELLSTIFTINWLFESFKQKIVDKNSEGVSVKEKLSMIYATVVSPKYLRFKESKGESTEKERIEPLPTLYHDSFSVKIDERFDQIAKQKKIKVRKNMVVLFDEPSFGGSAPKVNAIDLDLDNEWIVKWGDEVHTDVVGSRIFSGLGYDVDHPYFYGEERLTMVFNGFNRIDNVNDLLRIIDSVYDIDLHPFISSHGVITQEMADSISRLQPFLNKPYVRFVKCSIEARPDRVKRLGPFMLAEIDNSMQRELRASLLVHQLIGNWDTRNANTKLTQIHSGNYNYAPSAIFCDLGTSFGVRHNFIPLDFKVGLVNKFDWEVAKRKGKTVKLKERMNYFPPSYRITTYEDLHWMALKISTIDSLALRNIVNEANWPAPITELYFHKIASRRASILRAFKVEDPNPIVFNRKLSIKENGSYVIKKGKLILDYNRERNPESFKKYKGRMRNYGL